MITKLTRKHSLVLILALIAYLPIQGQTQSTYLQPAVPSPPVASAPGMAAGDLNSDGLDDIVVGGIAGFSILFAGPGGSFGPPVWVPYHGYQQAFYTLNRPVLIDIDSDSDLDILFMYGLPFRPVIYTGDGGGRFVCRSSAALLGSGPGLCVADVDLNGNLEIITTNGGYIGAPTGIQIATVIGAYTYTQTMNWNTGQYLAMVQIADVIGDACPDLIALSMDPASGLSTSIFIAVGVCSTSGFGPTVLVPLPAAATTQVNLSVADIDGNGKDDVLLLHNPGSYNGTSYAQIGLTNLYVATFPNIALPLWTSFPAPGMFTQAFEGFINVRDFNGDGFLDIASCCPFFTGPVGILTVFGNIVTLIGDGLGGFSAPQRTIYSYGGGPGFAINGQCCGDFDGDSDPDIFFSESGSTYLAYVSFNRARYGQGCAAPGVSPPSITAGLPQLGNAGFAIGVTGAAPSAAAVLGLSLTSLPPSQCGVLLSLAPLSVILPSGLAGFATTNVLGNATVPIAIPLIPALAGLAFFAQWGVAAPGGLQLTEGATVILQ